MKQYALDAATLGPAGKFATIVVLSAELARASDAEAVFEALLREDAALSLDAAVFSDEAATDEQPGRPALRRHADRRGNRRRPGGDGSRPRRACRCGGGGRRLGQRRLRRAPGAGRGGGDLRKPDLRLPVWPSRALPAGTVIAVDPTGFVSGFGAVPEISTSEQATVHMEDTSPAAYRHRGSAAVVAAPTRSLFQTRSIAIRLIADVAFTMRGDGLVQVVEDVTLVKHDTARTSPTACSQRAEATRERLEAELAEQQPVEAPPPRPWKAPARVAQAPFKAHEPPPPPLPTPARVAAWRAPAAPPKGQTRGTWIAVQAAKPGEEACLRWTWLPASDDGTLAEGIVKLLDMRDAGRGRRAAHRRRAAASGRQRRAADRRARGPAGRARGEGK